MNETITCRVVLATSGKNTDRSNDGRILSRDLLKKRNLLLTLLVSVAVLYSSYYPLIVCLGLRNRAFGNIPQSVGPPWASIRSGYSIDVHQLEALRHEWYFKQSLARVRTLSMVDFPGPSDQSVLHVSQLVARLGNMSFENWWISRIPKESLRLEIQRLVKSYPLQVRHIPEALSIFTLTSDNDRQCEVRRTFVPAAQRNTTRLNSSLDRHLRFWHGRRLIPWQHCPTSPVLDWIRLPILLPSSLPRASCIRRNQKLWFCISLN